MLASPATRPPELGVSNRHRMMKIHTGLFKSRMLRPASVDRSLGEGGAADRDPVRLKPDATYYGVRQTATATPADTNRGAHAKDDE
jgi:hypothetical protein